MKNLLLLLLLTIALNIRAQGIIEDGKSSTVFSMNKTTMFSISTPEKTKITFEDNMLIISNTAGSPFLYLRMKKGRVYYDKSILDFDNINYDALDDHFVIYSPEFKVKNSNLPLVQLNDNDIKAVIISNKKEKRFFIPVLFTKFKNRPKHNFFEIYTQDTSNALILTEIIKYRGLTHRNEGVQDENWNKKYKFFTTENYYVLNKDGKYIKTKLGKANIFRALRDKESEKSLKVFAKKNKLKWNKPKDIQKILEYYFSN